MLEQPFPYNLPIFRRSFSTQSPDGNLLAEIDPAYEVGMSDPTSGILCISNGLKIERCNPSMVWSDDSKYLAVPQWFNRLGMFRGQHLLVIDITKGHLFRSRWYWAYLQPEHFISGLLTVTVNPTYKPKSIAWNIPRDLSLFKQMQKEYIKRRVTS